MRGHQDIDKLWSIENTLPILEKLGFEYRILFGVPSPRIIIDDSPTYALACSNKHDWAEGSAEMLRQIAQQVKEGALPRQYLLPVTKQEIQE